jgi:hypothetical protein
MALNASNAKRYGIVCLAFAVLMLCGAALFAYSSWEAYSSRDWPRAAGIIVASYTEHTCGGYRQLNSWEAKLVYRYSVDGRQYEGHRVSVFKPFCDSDKEVVRGWLKQNFPLGKAVDVFYNSADPSSAFLHSGQVSKAELVMIVALIAIGGLLLWGSRMSFQVGGTRYVVRAGLRCSYRSKRADSLTESSENVERKKA